MSHHFCGPMLYQDTTSSLSESLDFMMEQECTTYSCRDYLHVDSVGDGDCDGDVGGGSDDSTCSSMATIHPRELLHGETVTPVDRMKLVDWCYTIVDRCGFQQETVAIAMNIVDRFASTPPASSTGSQEEEALHDCAKYQLVVVTALYTAIKLNERAIFGSQDFAAASRGMYSLEDIEGMELKIMHALSWRVCPPTSLQIANQILSLMLPEEAQMGTLALLQEEVTFQTENAVRDYYFVTQRPSAIAAAGIMNAIESIGNRDCEYLTEALICVLGTFPFDSYAVLLEVRNQLIFLADQEEDEDNGATMVSERTGVPPSQEESRNARMEEEALDPSDNYTYHSLVQYSLEQTPSSPRLVICDDAWDDSSCATTY